MRDRPSFHTRRQAASQWWPWVAVVAALYVWGGRFERRAALRGGSAALAARLGARAFGGVAGAQAATTASVATSVAFTAGSAQEQPWVAGPGVVVAALVLAGRLPRPAELVMGTALGAAVAVATRRPWPVAPHDPPATRRAPRRVVAGDRIADGEGVEIAVNLDAGRNAQAPPVAALRAELPRAEVTEIELRSGHELADHLSQAAPAARVLAVAGGDGSINAAAHVALAAGKPLLVIPSGTLNHLARDLGFETIEDGIRALKEGTLGEMDVAEIDGRPFLNTASFGSYAALVDARERLEERIGKWPAVVAALVDVLRKAQPVEVEVDGRRLRVWMAFFGNCRYRPSGFAPTWRERLDDGILDFRLVHAGHPLARTRLVTAVVMGRLGGCAVYEERLVRSVRIKSHGGTLRLARDGETFDASGDEVVVKKLDESLRIYANMER